MRITKLFYYTQQNDPYATHLNMLVAVGNEAKTILELGAGRYSTGMFLNKELFPFVEKLVTVESDPNWADAVKVNDPRHDMIVIPEPIETYLDTLDLESFDMIFVDNSTSGDRRCDTLRYVSEKVKKPLVVMHDFQVSTYAEAAKSFKHIIIDNRQEPWTALGWNNLA